MLMAIPFVKGALSLIMGNKAIAIVVALVAFYSFANIRGRMAVEAKWKAKAESVRIATLEADKANLAAQAASAARRARELQDQKGTDDAEIEKLRREVAERPTADQCIYRRPKPRARILWRGNVARGFTANLGG